MAYEQLAIEVHGLTKRYGQRRVVDDLDMHVPQGSIYGFVGKNGAGKTTTMRMIAGLCRPSGGEIELLGSSAAHSRTAIGALIEEPGLLPNLSATENLMAKSLAMGVRKPKKACQELLDLVGLGNVGRKKTKGFSLGMKQRLGLAMAMVGDPKVLMLDEPLNGLDPQGTREMREALSALSSSRGVTMIISSHVLDQLNRVADNFGVVADGRMVAEFSDADMQAACAGALRVRACNPLALRQAVGRRMPQIMVAQQSDGALLLREQNGATPDVEAVSRSLFEEGVILLELTVTSRDIEEFFVSLMNRGGRTSVQQVARTATSAPVARQKEARHA